mmetsp:Transcript_78146/g.216075  ORF Transcript_78146/g.216075 Transcript_78146/m.216075 type:complete len:217 (-) Transcript_78146:543-1193(-)
MRVHAGTKALEPVVSKEFERGMPGTCGSLDFKREYRLSMSSHISPRSLRCDSSRYCCTTPSRQSCNKRLMRRTSVGKLTFASTQRASRTSASRGLRPAASAACRASAKRRRRCAEVLGAPSNCCCGCRCRCCSTAERSCSRAVSSRSFCSAPSPGPRSMNTSSEVSPATAAAAASPTPGQSSSSSLSEYSAQACCPRPVESKYPRMCRTIGPKMSK